MAFGDVIQALYTGEFKSIAPVSLKRQIELKDD